MLLLAIIGGGSALAIVKVSQNIEYYSIKGNTASELREQMRLLGPRDYEGVKRWYLVKWQVKWHYKYRYTTKNCRVTSTDNILLRWDTLPVWTDQSQASATLRKSWESLMSAMRAEGDELARFGETATNDIDAAIRGMKPHKTCAELERDVRALVDSITQRYDQEEAEFVRKSGVVNAPQLLD